MFRKTIDLNGLEVEFKKRLSSENRKHNMASKGIAGENLIEPLPNFIEASCEKVFKFFNIFKLYQD